MSHYYRRNGESCFEVPKASKPDEMRNTTLADARKLDLLPSVTTYLQGMIEKPFLVKWGKEQVALAASTIPDSEWNVLTPEEKFQRCLLEAGEQMKQAQDFGTLVHDMAENFALTGNPPENPALMPWFEAFESWWKQAIDKVYFAEVTVVADRYAGRVDLIARTKEGETLLMDFKTRKRGKPTTKAEIAAGIGKFATYETDIIQLCAYKEATKYLPDCPQIHGVANIYIDSSNPTPPVLHRWEQDKVARYTKAWHSLVDAYCHLHEFYPMDKVA